MALRALSQLETTTLPHRSPVLTTNTFRQLSPQASLTECALLSLEVGGVPATCSPFQIYLTESML